MHADEKIGRGTSDRLVKALVKAVFSVRFDIHMQCGDGDGVGVQAGGVIREAPVERHANVRCAEDWEVPDEHVREAHGGCARS